MHNHCRRCLFGPAQWTLPVWLAWPPLAVTVLLAGLGACLLSWVWMVDASSAALVTQRLMTPDVSGRRRPLPASVVPPDGRWMTTTAQHLAHWAIFLRGSPPDPNAPLPDVSSMLTRSIQISPLNPTARLALAQNEPPGSGAPASIRTLGLSRDAVSLAWSARRLLKEGKRPAALRLYERALTVASAGEFPRTATPRFNDDLTSQRYLLPGEDLVRDIVAEMNSRDDWTFREWSKALPRNPTVLLATARLLRELAATRPSRSSRPSSSRRSRRYRAAEPIHAPWPRARSPGHPGIATQRCRASCIVRRSS